MVKKQKKEMQKWVIITVAVLTIAIIILGINALFFSGPNLDYSCTSDAECIVVKTDCCSCLSSDKDAKAINANSQGAWNEANPCGLSLCEQCENPEPTVSAACIDNKCKLV